MRAVVVTGSSTGIGHGTVKMLLERGFRVYGSVRKQADADRLTGEFGANYTPLLFDVTDEAAIVRAAAEVRAAQKGETLAGLGLRQESIVLRGATRSRATWTPTDAAKQATSNAAAGPVRSPWCARGAPRAGPRGESEVAVAVT